MFEFTISSGDNSNIINLICSMLKPTVEGMQGIIIKQNTHCIQSVCLAVENVHEDYIKSSILDAVSDAIISVYKQEYLMQNISLAIRNNVAHNSFIRALVVFDRQTDKDLIKKHLLLDEKLFVDSFYNFRLGELKQRWEDIANVVNESIPIMLKEKSVAEITRYFVDSTAKQIAELHLFIGQNSIRLKLDNKLSDLEFEFSDDYVDKILTEIISISPNKIIVHGKIETHKELKSALSSVFTDKICEIK